MGRQKTGEKCQRRNGRRHHQLAAALNRRRTAIFAVLLLIDTFASVAAMAGGQRQLGMARTTTTESIGTVDEANREFVQSLRIKALQHLQRSLESLSSLTANSLMLNAALQPSEETPNEDQEEKSWEEKEKEEEETEQQNPLFTTTAAHSVPSNGAKRNGILRIRADLKEIPLSSAMVDDFGTVTSPTMTTTTTTIAPAEEEWQQISERSPSTRARHLRSAAGRHHHHHNHKGGGERHGTTQQHKRRRKGCPTVQGKDQLLCPTRNSQRYDVCITRDQLCDRQRDCPGGEDEDPRHCFFFRPLEHSLKTISHAVLLLVDTVMREQEEQQQRNEL
ncbi:hypothetical protein niasHS_000275 [Heterodera schachtii]|uniref:Uncharacterized protein n=1 Tax=Heterodera schachtii TaxID=97005 RepID=A0ABD2KLI8_HETSC